MRDSKIVGATFTANVTTLKNLDVTRVVSFKTTEIAFFTQAGKSSVISTIFTFLSKIDWKRSARQWSLESGDAVGEPMTIAQASTLFKTSSSTADLVLFLVSSSSRSAEGPKVRIIIYNNISFYNTWKINSISLGYIYLPTYHLPADVFQWATA